ncbi:MAG: hypothetical protein KR126chlam6_00920 [Candidatus Anoxychlamydiales bacterium]|nr:hypothetical protein [Candidatus Anoxychlamydiales bacterium]
MAVQATQNLAKSPIKIPSLPSDMDKVVGMSNLLLIDIFSDISAFFYELYQKGTKLFENFSSDFKSEANRYSINIKQSVLEKILKLDLFHYSKEDDKKDMKKVVGKVNLLMIDGASYIAAFFKVVSHRLLHEHFLKDVKITALRFSYNMKMKIYSKLSNKEVKFEPIGWSTDSKKNEDVVFDLHPSKKEKKDVAVEAVSEAIAEKNETEIIKESEAEVSEKKEISEKNEHKKRNLYFYKIVIATLFLGYFVMFFYIFSDSQEKGFKRDNPKLVTLCVHPCYLNKRDISSLTFNEKSNCYYVQTVKYC